MDIKTTNRGMAELNRGCLELLEVEDLETLFSWRISSVIALISGEVTAFEKTVEKLSQKYGTEDLKDGKGEIIGKRPADDKLGEYTDKIQHLMDVGIEFTVPTVRMSEIVRMREEEGVPIKASSIHLARLIVRMDVDPESGDEVKEPPKKGRAEKAKAKAEAKEDKGGSE